MRYRIKKALSIAALGLLASGGCAGAQHEIRYASVEGVCLAAENQIVVRPNTTEQQDIDAMTQLRSICNVLLCYAEGDPACQF